MSAAHDHEHERTEHTMSRLQPTHNGLALCHRVILDSGAHQWVQGRTPTAHRCPKGKAVGAPTQAPRQDDRQTTTRQQTGLSRTCFQETSADRHLYTYSWNSASICLPTPDQELAFCFTPCLFVTCFVSIFVFLYHSLFCLCRCRRPSAAESSILTMEATDTSSTSTHLSPLTSPDSGDCDDHNMLGDFSVMCKLLYLWNHALMKLSCEESHFLDILHSIYFATKQMFLCVSLCRLS